MTLTSPVQISFCNFYLNASFRKNYKKKTYVQQRIYFPYGNKDNMYMYGVALKKIHDNLGERFKFVYNHTLSWTSRKRAPKMSIPAGHSPGLNLVPRDFSLAKSVCLVRMSSFWDNNPVLRIEQFRSLLLSRDALMLQHLIIHFLLTAINLKHGRLWEVKNKRKFQTFQALNVVAIAYERWSHP